MQFYGALRAIRDVLHDNPHVSAADRPPMPPPTITTRTGGICINPIAVSAWQGSTRYLRPP
jgi:hypothetical protein